MKPCGILLLGAAALGWVLCPALPAAAWHDETHLAVARAAGYAKWHHAAGADMAKLKAGDREAHNHYVNQPRATPVTPGLVLSQAARYDTVDRDGHLYGAIVAALRNYAAARAQGKYGEYHLAFAAHYLGDLSMPLHNLPYDDFNRRNHAAMDGIVNEEVLERWREIRVYPVAVASEEDLAREIARVANLAIALGERLRAQDRMPTRQEAYEQLSHSASLLRAVLVWMDAPRGTNEAGGGPPGRSGHP